MSPIFKVIFFPSRKMKSVLNEMHFTRNDDAASFEMAIMWPSLVFFRVKSVFSTVLESITKMPKFLYWLILRVKNLDFV